MKRVALYARVSTLDKGQNPEMQLAELRAFTKAREWGIVVEHVDHCSGAKERRPQLDKLMADARARRFDVVLVWKLDRFARSLKQLVNSVEEFDALGIAFVSLRDQFDLTTPSGRLQFQIIGAMSQFERDLIRERVIAGIAHAKATGKTWKRGPQKKPATSRTTLWRRAQKAVAH
jgi:DNA invertase Pin-like site-specific DNA recombinase